MGRREDAGQSLLLIIGVLLILVSTGLAQQIGNPTTQQGVTPARGIYAIRNAHIVTVSGPDIDNGTLVVRDGKIESVGANVSAPSGAETIDAHGLWVYPGMMDAALRSVWWRWAREPTARSTPVKPES